MSFFAVQKQFQGVLLAAALLCTAAASFLPYSVELPLGVAALLLADHAVCIRDENRPGWVLIAVMVGCALSTGLTIVLLIGHVLGVVPVIEALNLLLIAISSIGAVLQKGNAAYRVLIVTSALYFSFGAFSHIVYGRSVMATVAEWVLLSQKVSELKNVSIFVGTRELFYPDDTLLYEKLRDNENVKLYIGKGLNHVYPAFPIPEGRAGVQQIIRIIQR